MLQMGLFSELVAEAPICFFPREVPSPALVLIVFVDLLTGEGLAPATFLTLFPEATNGLEVARVFSVTVFRPGGRPGFLLLMALVAFRSPLFWRAGGDPNLSVAGMRLAVGDPSTPAIIGPGGEGPRRKGAGIRSCCSGNASLRSAETLSGVGEEGSVIILSALSFRDAWTM